MPRHFSLALILVFVFVSRVAHALVFTVINTNDSGAGSLRQAITNANNQAGADTIEFLISGAGVHTITPLSVLPTITEAVTIDGYSQPGASANTLTLGDNAVILIELNGNGAAFAGLIITGGNTTVRGLAINRFNGNGPANGITITTNGGNHIEGCFIGLNPAGTTDLSNSRIGLDVESAGNTIGGTAAAARNLIVSAELAIWLPPDNAGGNIIQGNYIGTDKTGNVGLGTTSFVEIKTPNNTFGGTASGARNVLGANTGLRLNGANSLDASGNTVQGNYIGVKADGTGVLSNNGGGIDMLYSGNNLIGGTSAAARNVIAVGGGPISIAGVNGGNNTVQGNFIGINPAGTAAMGGVSAGPVTVSSDGNLIGGTDPGAGNVIGNCADGITIFNANNNVVQGNFIGTDKTGTTAIPNGVGIKIVSAFGTPTSHNTIGGTTAAARNIISGNNSQGIYIAAADTTMIEGNYIGVAADGVSPLPNRSDGIQIGTGSNNTIGGIVAGAGNVIALNGVVGFSSAGLKIFDGTGNKVLGNSIFGNTRIGIDLYSQATENAFAVNPNDAGDGDSGPNNLQNYPVLTSVTNSGGMTHIAGTLNSLANTPFRIEFFSSDALDPSGYGEGENFIGSKDVTTSASGDASFNTAFAQIGAGERVTATATDPNGNTSEFSAAIGQLLNISTRMKVLTGGSVLIGGFIVGGSGNTDVLLRALGPTLTQFGINGVLGDPTMELRDGTGALIMSNDNWKDTQQAAIAATGKAPPNDLESAILHTYTPGNYTAIVRGKGNATGVALVEAYDIDQSPDITLTNISTRGFVDVGQEVMIGGFISGDGIVKVIVRALGPTLTQFGVPMVLADPTLELRDANGAVVASNDNWKDTQQAEIQASGKAPPNNNESAIIVTRPPANTTAIVSGKNNTTGNALVEVYILPP